MTTPIAAGLVDADVRARFEKWITSPPFEKTIERHGKNGSWPGNYRDYSVQIAWCAWEDSAKAELDACRTAVRGVMVTDHGLNTWNRCVAAIEKRSKALAQADAACGVSPGAMGSASAGLEKK